MRKRVLGFLLCLVMPVGLMPMTVFTPSMERTPDAMVLMRMSFDISTGMRLIRRTRPTP